MSLKNKLFILLLFILIPTSYSHGQWFRWLSSSEKKWSCRPSYKNLIGTYENGIELKSICYKMISLKEYPKYKHKQTGQVIPSRGVVTWGWKCSLKNPTSSPITFRGSVKLYDEDGFEVSEGEFKLVTIPPGLTKNFQSTSTTNYDNLKRIKRINLLISTY